MLGGSFIRRWKSGRGRSGGNILDEDISNLLLLGKVNGVEERVCLIIQAFKPQLLEYPAAKKPPFAAQSKFVYWNKILFS